MTGVAPNPVIGRKCLFVLVVLEAVVPGHGPELQPSTQSRHSYYPVQISLIYGYGSLS